MALNGIYFSLDFTSLCMAREWPRYSVFFFLLSPDRACKLKFSCRFLVVNSGLKIDLYKKKGKIQT